MSSSAENRAKQRAKLKKRNRLLRTLPRVERIIDGQKVLVTLCPSAVADGAGFFRQAPMRGYIQRGD